MSGTTTRIPHRIQLALERRVPEEWHGVSVDGLQQLQVGGPVRRRQANLLKQSRRQHLLSDIRRRGEAKGKTREEHARLCRLSKLDDIK